MAEGSANQIVFPFHGIRYNPVRHHDLSALLAAPYDVIDAEQQAELYARHPLNFVRLELGVTRSTDSEVDNRYTRAAADLQMWLQEGDLIRDEQPALYVVETEFTLGGRRWWRRGVLAAVRLPEKGERYVLEHEDTFAAAREDRFHLVEAARVQISPTLSLCEDHEGRLQELLGRVDGAPEAVAEIGDNVHRMWVVGDEARAAALGEAASAGPLFIADGHHRFLTAKRHREAMRARYPKAPPEAGFNYALMLLVSARDDSVKVLPVHRLLSGLGPEGVAWVKSRVMEGFETEMRERPRRWEELDAELLTEAARPDRHAYRLYCADGTFMALVVREAMLPPGGSPVDRLDVTVLHSLLLDPLWHCDPHLLATECDGVEVAYTVDVREAAEAVGRGQREFAFFVRPTRVDQVLAVARAGARMPHKSTYFYPKAPSGLVVSDASAEHI